jgi:protein-L-isoaspartate O-methyltransferase
VPARGRVVEIGFGSGLNLRHYPAAVQSIVAVEPNAGMHERAAERIKASRIPVEIASIDPWRSWLKATASGSKPCAGSTRRKSPRTHGWLTVGTAVKA